MLKAIVTSPRDSQYGVDFYYTQSDSPRRDYNMPVTYVPCRDYSHARAVADAFNASQEG